VARAPASAYQPRPRVTATGSSPATSPS